MLPSDAIMGYYCHFYFTTRLNERLPHIGLNHSDIIAVHQRKRFCDDMLKPGRTLEARFKVSVENLKTVRLLLRFEYLSALHTFQC
jgi:hypothetical protein